MNVDWTPLKNAVAPLWKAARDLFAEHHFITILCAFFAVLMVISFYKFLRSISPALVGLVLVLILAILIMHWTATRTEPAFMKPFIDSIAPFFPSTTPTPVSPKA